MDNRIIILEASNISVTKSKQLIIDDVNFSIYKNEIVMIVGPNGAGKSTLLKALIGLIPFRGTVTWRVNKINYLPPQESFNRDHMPPMTILEFFSFKHASKEKTTQSLAEAGLDATYLSRSLLHLSTGEFQRMLLAWSLVDNPEVLVLDEPSSGLDIQGEDLMYKLLHKVWHERGITIIIVTHNLNVVWQHAHRIVCLNKNVVCLGKPQAVLTPETLELVYGKGAWIYEHKHGRQ